MSKGKELSDGSHEPCVIVHGGAWTLPPQGVLTEQIIEGVQQAAIAGYRTLLKGGNAVDGVEAAVKSLEDTPVFNAGYGSVLTEDGTVEMDAMIMDGRTLNAGAVACVPNVANPVALARRVMENTPHCLLVGAGAVKFAQSENIPLLEDPNVLITEFSKLRSKLVNPDDKKNFNSMLVATMNTETRRKKKDAGVIEERLARQMTHDTVGAVVMDCHGNIAAATSTGGIPYKMVGRVGDSPLVGSGGYANVSAGASTTGHGESILKVVLAYDVVKHIENGAAPSDACKIGLKNMFDLTDGQGGVICIDKNGDYGKAFTTEAMSWAAIKGGILKYGAFPGETNQHHERIS